MATAARIDVALRRPSEEIRQAQEVVRSILLKDDLSDEPQILEAVNLHLCELEAELGELAGKQMFYESVMLR